MVRSMPTTWIYSPIIGSCHPTQIKSRDVDIRILPAFLEKQQPGAVRRAQ
jgi:hypothetical protein